MIIMFRRNTLRVEKTPGIIVRSVGTLGALKRKSVINQRDILNRFDKSREKM